MRTAVLLLVLGSMLSTASIALAQEKQTPEITSTASKVVDLQVERRKVLSEVAEIANIHFKNGAVMYDTVCEAEIKLAAADLPLAQTANARQAIHKRKIEWLQKLEDYREVQFKNANGGRVEYLNAKADRLQAEIDMLQDRIDVSEK